jgi:Regulator of chromosome condensation (RCC1) repeat
MKNSKKNIYSDTKHSIILQKGFQYSGPVRAQSFPFYSPFNTFRVDLLYCYPILSYASTKTTDNQAIIPYTEFTYPECSDLKETINEFCLVSPFKSLEHATPEITYSSINTVEFGLDRYDSESNKLNSSKREQVKKLLQDLNEKDDTSSNEISINLDVSSFSSRKPNSYSSLSSKSIFCMSDSSNSIIPTNEEELITCSKDSYIVELMPECSYDTSNLRSSSEISGIDEGSTHITTRLFLPGACASNNILSATPEPQVYKYIQVKNISLLQPEIPNVMSPIYRKLVLCGKISFSKRVHKEDPKVHTALEIKSCISCSGFISSVTLEFSNIETQSRGIINYKSPQISRLLSANIITDMSNRNITWISFGFEHCCILNTNGEVFTWGYGASGCLGHGNVSSSTSPVKLSRLPRVIYIECGAYHNAAISEAGELFVWGRGDVNQLGVSNRLLVQDKLGYFAPFPLKVEFFMGKVIKTLACGEAHTLVVDNEGGLYSFGWAEDGQLGLPSTRIKDNYMSYSIRRVSYLKHKKIVKVSAGALFSIAISENGEIYSWGNGDLGQLGLGNSTKHIGFPTAILSLEKEVIVDAICGESHVICVSKNGTLYGWGQGLAGIFETKGNNFPYGSDIVCYLPRRLVELDISHRIIIP